MKTKIERQAEKERGFSANRLRTLLHYDPDTGIFRWRFGSRGHALGATAGRLSGAGYRQIYVDGLYFYAHRLAWLYITGQWPKGDVDHRDTVKTNNRFANLRHASKGQNQGNRPTNRNNRSGIKGVRWSRAANRWHARITRAGRDVHLGYFDDVASAATAYAKAACEQFGDFARVA